ncbi:Rpn family recombination-promoting nuclease/putative transposase [Spirosoma soli]|uniref:Rpn family recombination-promoting nuclease/putative transposase n=1 Tax=Spirosoma soli TaxID=1770529 RepID=A0ABW5M573_9BACT
MNHIHDRFFKSVFSQSGVVASLIADLFPPDLASAIAIDSLRLTNDSYIDDALNEHLADLVYECHFNDGLPFVVALLLEHKSYVELHPHLQLLRYMLNRWQEDLQHKRKLTPLFR